LPTTTTIASTYFDPPGSIETAIATLTETEKGRLHPDFAELMSSADIILQSDDGILFLFDTDVLKERSTFFKDLLSIPTDIEPMIIPLHSANSAELAIALTVLKAISTATCSFYLGPEPYSAANGDVSLILAVLRIADAYDISFIIEHLPTETIITFQDDPFLYFALFAIKGDGWRAKRASTNTLRLPIDEMSVQVEGILSSLAPKYLDQLRSLHAERAEQPKAFRELLYSEEKMYNKFDGFSNNCRMRNHCSAMERFNGDFTRLRRAAADAVLEKVYPKGSAWQSTSLYPVLMEVTGCHRCSTRFTRTFESAAKKNIKAFRGSRRSI
jgi:hypothetical protein